MIQCVVGAVGVVGDSALVHTKGESLALVLDSVLVWTSDESSTGVQLVVLDSWLVQTTSEYVSEAQVT